jgi:hypothetical protein
MKQLLLLLFLTVFSFAQYNPNYNSSLKQNYLDLSNNYVILTVNLKPGDEDINALTELRLSKGYKVVNLFITRGESEADYKNEKFNEKLAVDLSQKAKNISNRLGISNYYLNLKNGELNSKKEDIIREWGGKDYVINQIKNILNLIKPDIIMISGAYGKDSSIYVPYYAATSELFLETVSKININDSLKASKSNWKVKKIYCRVSKSSGSDINLFPDKMRSFDSFDKNYFVEQYGSILNGFSKSRLTLPSFYKLYFTSSKVNSRSKDLSSNISLKFKGSDQLEKVISNLIKQNSLPKEQMLNLVQKTDAILDVFKKAYKDIEPIGDRILATIKNNISELRINLLGIKIDKYLSDSAVCRRQLVKFSIDSLHNLKEGTTTIIFYNMDDTNWVVMRGYDYGKKYKVKFKEPFLVVTPSSIPLNAPKEIYQYDFYTELPLIEYVIIHQAKNPIYSFQYFGREFINVVDKADFEVTPKNVFVKNTTNLEFNLTHYLNDPYKNIMPHLNPADSYVGSFKATKFNVVKKYDKIQGKIEFTINDSLKEGSYPVRFTIGEPIVSEINIKKFNLSADTAIRAAIFSDKGEILTRFMKSVMIPYSLNPDFKDLSNFNTIIIDENFSDLIKDQNYLTKFDEFVNKGGNLVILKQDNLSGLSFINYKISNKNLEFSFCKDNALPLIPGDKIFKYPNMISDSDWLDWSTERGNSIPTKYDKNFEELVKIESGINDLRGGILRLIYAKGSVFYISLSFKRQLDSVNPGVYKIFTNIISFKNEK